MNWLYIRLHYPFFCVDNNKDPVAGKAFILATGHPPFTPFTYLQAENRLRVSLCDVTYKPYHRQTAVVIQRLPLCAFLKM